MKKTYTEEQKNEVLQLSPCAVSAPLHEHYQVIKDLSDHYSVNLLWCIKEE